MKSLIKKFLKIIVDFWEFFLTFCIALLSIALNFISVAGINQQQIVTGAILLVLTTLTASILRDRNRLKKIEQLLIKSLRDKAKVYADDFLTPAGLDPYSNYRNSLLNAKKIIILGISNLKTISNYEIELKNALRKGAKIQILMLDPEQNNPALVIQAMRHPHKLGIQNLVSHGIEACEILERMNLSSNGKGILEVKGLKYFPTFGFLAINPEEKNGVMCTKLYPFALSKSEYPTFTLHATRDEKWFQFFISQFEQLWKISNPIKTCIENKKNPDG